MSDTPTLTENLPTELRSCVRNLRNRDDAGLAGALLAAADEIERLRADLEISKQQTRDALDIADDCLNREQDDPTRYAQAFGGDGLVPDV